VLGTGERGRYIVAATFGNVHGVYKPGNVKLRPEILRDGQQALAEAHPGSAFQYVFHGGSGSRPEEIAAAVSFGVVKMNVDTDMQYAFTRPIAGHMFEHYDGVLRVDDEVGDKKAFDPRSYGKLAEAAMATRVVQACTELGSAGRTVYSPLAVGGACAGGVTSAGRRSRPSSSATMRPSRPRRAPPPPRRAGAPPAPTGARGRPARLRGPP